MAARDSERTEAPTARRVAEARRRGEIALSRELTSAVAMAAAFAVLAGTAPGLIARVVAHLRASLRAATQAATIDTTLDGSSAGAALGDALRFGASLLALPLGVAAAAALVVALLQTRGLVALSPVRPDLGRLGPGAGWRRLAGGRAAAEAGQALLRALLLGAVAFAVARTALGALPALTGAPPARALAALGRLALVLGGWIVAAAVVLGAGDFALAWWRHRGALHMTRDEIRREVKETEGDPAYRAERRRLRRESFE